MTEQATHEIAPDQQAAIDNLTKAVAQDLSNGTQPRTIVEMLIKQGWQPGNAQQYVANVQASLTRYRASNVHRSQLANQYARHMIFGLLWAVGGTVITVATYSAASNGGGRYVIAWGAIVFGIIDFFRGLIGWLGNR